MLILATTGKKPAAAAWSINEEEPQGVARLLFGKLRLYRLGQHRAGSRNFLSQYRKIAHRRNLFRPNTRRHRVGHRAGDRYSVLHRQQHRSPRRYGVAIVLGAPIHRSVRPGKPEFHPFRPFRLDDCIPRSHPCGRCIRSFWATLSSTTPHQRRPASKSGGTSLAPLSRTRLQSRTSTRAVSRSTSISPSWPRALKAKTSRPPRSPPCRNAQRTLSRHIRVA
jgi:hypothetical protein